MPSQVGATVSAQMRKAALEVGRARRTAVERSAFAAKDAQLAEIDRVTTGRRLRGVGRSGARVGARYDVKGQQNPTAIVRATGPLHLLENPIKPHEIAPKKRRGKGKKAVVTPAGPRAKVQHPGVSTPKKPWAKGLDKARPKVKREMDRTFTAAFRRGVKR